MKITKFLRTVTTGIPRYGWLLLLGCCLVMTIQPMVMATVAPGRSEPDAVHLQAASPAQGIAAGKQLYETGRFADAALAWQRAAQTYHIQGEQGNQALSLSYLSLAYQAMGHWEEAKQAIAASLDLLKTVPRSGSIEIGILAQTLNTQGQLQAAMGQLDAALKTWQEAETAYQQANDPAGRLGSQINQAYALQNLGLFRRAQLLLEQVSQQVQSQPASSLKATGLRNLGVVWQVVGDLDQSKSILQASLAVAQQLNLPAEISATLLSLGNTARSRHDVPTALDFYQQAATVAPTPIARLKIWANHLSLLIEDQRWSEAKALWQQIQPQLTERPPSRTGIYTQVNLATSWMALDRQSSRHDLQPIAQLLANAVQQARDINDERSESYALGTLGTLYQHNQQWQEAQDLTQKALVIAQSSNAPEIAYRWLWQLGQIAQKQGHRPAAIQAYTDAVKLLKTLRGDLLAMSPEVQFSFREAVEPVYRELVSLLVEPPSPSQLELQQARQVIESLQVAELENFLRSACLEARPSQIDRVDPEAAVIYPIILPERLVVILSLPGQPLSTYSTALPKQQVEAVLEHALESLNPIFADQERLRLAQQVYDWLIKPAEPALQHSQIKTLVFVLDGILRNIPMAALHDGQQYLVEKYSLAITPGLQLLEPRSLTQEQRLQALIGGLTEARQGFSALPGVARESDQIATKLAAQVVLDQKFTQQNMQEVIRGSSFPLVHLATHGQFSSQLSDTFVLTWDSRLTVEGLRNLLKLRSEADTTPIELLVLSACETAEGDQRAALGLAGLAIRSGARSTLATLWSVNDDSTTELMVKFYQALTQDNTSKAESLRQAQLTLLNHPQYRHPFYWAPFILVGNWL